jgi:hypothetical protein
MADAMVIWPSPVAALSATMAVIAERRRAAGMLAVAGMAAAIMAGAATAAAITAAAGATATEGGR